MFFSMDSAVNHSEFANRQPRTRMNANLRDAEKGVVISLSTKNAVWKQLPKGEQPPEGSKVSRH